MCRRHAWKVCLSIQKRVVYLGDLKEVADLLKNFVGFELVAWIAEKDDEVVGPDHLVSSSAELTQLIKKYAPLDLGIVANFGIILPRECLSLAKDGFINAHMGLLPQRPGRLPIKKALEAGDEVVGVTLHCMTENVDAGSILLTKTFAAGPNPDPQTIFERMVRLIPTMLTQHLRPSV